MEKIKCNCSTCKHGKEGKPYFYDLCLQCGNNSNYVPQTPPKPEQAANQEPAREEKEPAQNSIAEKEITVKEVLLYELEQQEAKYEPTDNDYNDEPQRKTFTSYQYNALLNDTEERQSALSKYCERQAFNSMLKRWAGEVFEHTGLSRKRKLEMIGKLLDLEVEA